MTVVEARGVMLGTRGCIARHGNFLQDNALPVIAKGGTLCWRTNDKAVMLLWLMLWGSFGILVVWFRNLGKACEKVRYSKRGCASLRGGRVSGEVCTKIEKFKQPA